MEQHCCHDFNIDVGHAILYFPVCRMYYFEPSIDINKIVDLYKKYVLSNKTCTTKAEREFVRFLGYTECHKLDNIEKLYFSLDRINLKYCPYCGKKLPLPLREVFCASILMEYGPEYVPSYSEKYWCPEITYNKISDKIPQPLPDEFKSDEWWKKRNLDTKEGYLTYKKKFCNWVKQHPTYECTYIFP